MNKRELFKKKVINTKEITTDVIVLEFERTGKFKAGQVVAITNSETIAPRLYSLASGEKDEYFKILFDIKHEGELSPKLSKLKAGDSIMVSLPFGKFIDNAEPSFWIATGTGIAPFVSKVQSGLIQNKTLIHGARTLNGFYFEDLFNKKLNGNYRRFCTSENAPHVNSGRLTNWLKDAELENNIKYYLCGGSEMVVEVRDILLSKGVGFNNIVAEIYF